MRTPTRDIEDQDSPSNGDFIPSLAPSPVYHDGEGSDDDHLEVIESSDDDEQDPSNLDLLTRIPMEDLLPRYRVSSPNTGGRAVYSPRSPNIVSAIPARLIRQLQAEGVSLGNSPITFRLSSPHGSVEDLTQREGSPSRSASGVYRPSPLNPLSLAVPKSADTEQKSRSAGVLPSPQGSPARKKSDASAKFDAMSVASNDGPVCRICQMEEDSSLGEMIAPCECSGSLSLIHSECLLHWILTRPDTSKLSECEICKTPYTIKFNSSTDCSQFCRAWNVMHYAECVCLIFFLVLLLIFWQYGDKQSSFVWVFFLLVAGLNLMLLIVFIVMRCKRAMTKLVVVVADEPLETIPEFVQQLRDNADGDMV
eukprot:GFYU01002735.1.p1 GENE.GFYU01002735.1~~GFYU01002735.1.p1  ORF type:complete len:366 (+),score=54.79 GFYU01002735.1:233-1330(+)